MKLLSRNEEIILLAVWRLAGDAFGISIRDQARGRQRSGIGAGHGLLPTFFSGRTRMFRNSRESWPLPSTPSGGRRRR